MLLRLKKNIIGHLIQKSSEISLVLMTECNSEKILDNMFYEADVAYIGARSKEPGHQGCGTEQQPFFIALSTSRNSNYPQFIK